MTPQELCEEWSRQIKRTHGENYKFSVSYYRGWFTTGAPTFCKYRRKAVEIAIERLKQKPDYK